MTFPLTKKQNKKKANVKPPCLWCFSCSCLVVHWEKELRSIFSLSVFLLWCNVKPSNGEWLCKFKKQNKEKPWKPLATFLSSYCLFPGQTVVYCTMMRFLWCKRLCLFFLFYYNLLLYRVYAVKSVDLYQNYLSENIETLVCPKNCLTYWDCMFASVEAQTILPCVPNMY